MACKVLMFTDKWLLQVSRPEDALLCFAHAGRVGRGQAIRVMVKGEGDTFQEHEDDLQFTIRGEPRPELLVRRYGRVMSEGAEEDGRGRVLGSSDGGNLLLTTDEDLVKVRRDSKWAALKFMRVETVDGGMRVRVITKGAGGRWKELDNDVQFTLFGSPCTDHRLIDHYSRTKTGNWKGWAAPPRRAKSKSV